MQPIVHIVSDDMLDDIRQNQTKILTDRLVWNTTIQLYPQRVCKRCGCFGTSSKCVTCYANICLMCNMNDFAHEVYQCRNCSFRTQPPVLPVWGSLIDGRTFFQQARHVLDECAVLLRRDPKTMMEVTTTAGVEGLRVSATLQVDDSNTVVHVIMALCFPLHRQSSLGVDIGIIRTAVYATNSTSPDTSTGYQLFEGESLTPHTLLSAVHFMRTVDLTCQRQTIEQQISHSLTRMIGIADRPRSTCHVCFLPTTDPCEDCMNPTCAECNTHLLRHIPKNDGSQRCRCIYCDYVPLMDYGFTATLEPYYTVLDGRQLLHDLVKMVKAWASYHDPAAVIKPIDDPIIALPHQDKLIVVTSLTLSRGYNVLFQASLPLPKSIDLAQISQASTPAIVVIGRTEKVVALEANTAPAITTALQQLD